MDDGANMMILKGHGFVSYFGHAPKYHKHVLKKLIDAVKNLKPGTQQYRNAFLRALQELREELLENPWMITGYGLPD